MNKKTKRDIDLTILCDKRENENTYEVLESDSEDEDEYDSEYEDEYESEEETAIINDKNSQLQQN
jgi:hypothetical protein